MKPLKSGSICNSLRFSAGPMHILATRGRMILLLLSVEEAESSFFVGKAVNLEQVVAELILSSSSDPQPQLFEWVKSAFGVPPRVHRELATQSGLHKSLDVEFIGLVSLL
ncbi:hypothetical protein K469DRAFT_710013 [Zopfia rhizophila CBS 207.26]|uniref:Uncharacterized protein n=1 Tax=Zopfia rhizophila CBS 207.26 TaxID=1314779 RepID=A0A6A6E2H5_9PEZI|nr:hypothetical protein K469DRAFT_710013 [Zopfia rhizophila CBS 207.26]